MNAPTDLARLLPRLEGTVSAEEWQTRVDLAAAYRLVAHFHWDDLVFTHITAKIPGTEHFLINPYGLMFDEMTASSLIKIDIEGNVLQETSFPINPAGFTIHSAVHGARHDVQCVMHTHTLNGVAVSAQKRGVLPISQQSIFVLASLGYHDYEGVALRDDEKPRLVASLGDKTFLMLRNHGLLTVGSTIAGCVPGDVPVRGDVRDPDPRAGRRHARERRPHRGPLVDHRHRGRAVARRRRAAAARR